MLETATGRKRRARKQFIRSLEETAARAVVTAAVTFAVGWLLKRMFEKSVAEAAQAGAAAGVEDQLGQPADSSAEAEPEWSADSIRQPIPVT